MSPCDHARAAILTQSGRVFARIMQQFAILTRERRIALTSVLVLVVARLKTLTPIVARIRVARISRLLAQTSAKALSAVALESGVDDFFLVLSTRLRNGHALGVVEAWRELARVDEPLGAIHARAELGRTLTVIRVDEVVAWRVVLARIRLAHVNERLAVLARVAVIALALQ